MGAGFPAELAGAGGMVTPDKPTAPRSPFDHVLTNLVALADDLDRAIDDLSTRVDAFVVHDEVPTGDITDDDVAMAPPMSVAVRCLADLCGRWQAQAAKIDRLTRRLEI